MSASPSMFRTSTVVHKCDRDLAVLPQNVSYPETRVSITSPKRLTAVAVYCPATRKRSKLELYFDLLKVVGSGETKPTRIRYRVNLSWVAMEALLHWLVD